MPHLFAILPHWHTFPGYSISSEIQ